MEHAWLAIEDFLKNRLVLLLKSRYCASRRKASCDYNNFIDDGLHSPFSAVIATAKTDDRLVRERKKSYKWNAKGKKQELAI